MKIKDIQIIERAGKYCVRYKIGFFWRYVDLDGWDFFPNFWMNKETAEREYNSTIDYYKQKELFKNSPVKVITNEDNWIKLKNEVLELLEK
jgi:hypothetical protein